MIRFVRGDLFASKAQTLVNTVNCKGVMGKGIALLFKKRFPEMYHQYRLQCERNEIKPGVLMIYKDTKPWIINFPTKRHWRSRSRLEDIKDGLEYFVSHYREWGVTSVAMPALGCGLGGLDWAKVKPLMVKYLEPLEIEIEVFEPGSETTSNGSSHYSKIENLFGELVEPPETKVKRKRGKKGIKRYGSA